MWFAVLFTCFGMSIGIVVAVIAHRVVECCDRARGIRVSTARTTSPASSDGDTDHEDVMVVAEGLHHRGDPDGEGCRRRIMSPGEAAALDTLIREGESRSPGGLQGDIGEKATVIRASLLSRDGCTFWLAFWLSRDGCTFWLISIAFGGCKGFGTTWAYTCARCQPVCAEISRD